MAPHWEHSKAASHNDEKSNKISQKERRKEISTLEESPPLKSDFLKFNEKKRIQWKVRQCGREGGGRVPLLSGGRCLFFPVGRQPPVATDTR